MDKTSIVDKLIFLFISALLIIIFYYELSTKIDRDVGKLTDQIEMLSGDVFYLESEVMNIKGEIIEHD